MYVTKRRNKAFKSLKQGIPKSNDVLHTLTYRAGPLLHMKNVFNRHPNPTVIVQSFVLRFITIMRTIGYFF